MTNLVTGERGRETRRREIKRLRHSAVGGAETGPRTLEDLVENLVWRERKVGPRDQQNEPH